MCSRCEYAKQNEILVEKAIKDDSRRLKEKKKSKKVRSESGQKKKISEQTESEQNGEKIEEQTEFKESRIRLESSTVLEKSANIKATEEEKSSKETLCGKCKRSYNGRTRMIQCNHCDKWYHFRCEHVTQKEAAEEHWYCAACREPVESKEAYSTESNASVMLDEAARVEILNQKLTSFGHFLEYLIDKPVPADEKFVTKLRLCQVRLDQAIAKHGECKCLSYWTIGLFLFWRLLIDYCCCR